MKYLLFIFPIILLLVSGCSNDENPTASKLNGKWQLMEVYFYNDLSDEYSGWFPAEQSHFLKFDSNFTFSSDEYPSCTKGFFNCNSNSIKLSYNCPQSDFSVAYNIIELNESTLIISLQQNIYCLGICQYKFTKVSD